MDYSEKTNLELRIIAEKLGLRAVGGKDDLIRAIKNAPKRSVEVSGEIVETASIEKKTKKRKSKK
jgi:hypothetical protein